MCLKRNFIQTVVQTGDTLFLSYSLCPSVYTIDYQHYRSLPQYTGSWGNRFQETHGIWIYFWFAVNTTTGSTVKRSNLSLQSSLVLGKNTNLRLLIIHLISNTNFCYYRHKGNKLRIYWYVLYWTFCYGNVTFCTHVTSNTLKVYCCKSFFFDFSFLN